ncbi:MAG: hypothetical protein NC826_04530 [Candidatus Omnitrophica bacterium]|nr:hypothetical protein [Candidatus Omnitrophota bacterium]
MDKKKWLIIYVSAGEGHRRAAEALYRYIKENSKEIDVIIFDALDFSNFLFKIFYRKGYNFLVKKLPSLWRVAYTLTRFKFLTPIRFCVNRVATSGLKKYILRCKPDKILTTHFLPAEVLSYLKRRGLLSSFLAVVITDFVPHPFWIFKEVDRFFVASYFSRNKLILYGIDEYKISITGIPVNLNFSLDLDKKGLYKKLNLREDLFTVLIVTAGFGLGPIEKLVKILYNQVQLMVVCGYNQRLFRKLKKNYPNIKVFGFVENMEELMSVCNIIITKPGGLTISEALVKDVPMIFISPIFGQETENIRIMEGLGIGKALKDVYKIKEFILRCKANPEIISSIIRKISSIKKPYAVKEIVCALR